jgi:hypothetical protein
MYSEWIFKPNGLAVCKNCGVSISPHSVTTPYRAYCGCRMTNWQNLICECFEHVYGHDVCYGTKELEECSCGGDRRKCDFYEDIRLKANAAEGVNK